VLVACYVKAQPDLTPKEYWKIFQKKLSSYIKPEGECHDDEDERLLHTIWKESVDTVKSRCPAAISILEVWSLLHNLDFRFELLSNYDLLQGTSPEMRTLVRNELDGHRKFSDAMFHLTTFSLIDATSTLPCSYNMPSVFHNWCTQALVVEQHKDSLLSVLECLGTSIPGRKEEGYLKKTTQILLHASRVVEELGDIMVKERNQPPVRNHLENSVFDGKKILIQVNAMMNLAEVFRAQEKLPLARRLLHCTTRVLEAAPESDEKQDVTDGLNEVLGHLHKSENQLKKAKNFYKKALAGYLKRHGPNHDATLGARSNLGSIYTKLEMRNEAEDEFRLVLATEVTTKEGEKLKLDCKQRYATLLSGWKEVANARYKALDFHQQVFDTSLEWYSKNDHRTARAAHNLAHIQRLLQQFQPAKRLYDVYLPILEHYVPNRALLFNAQNGYGDLLRRMRKFKDAERWLLRARQGLQDLDYGPRDMNYAQVAIHLGDLYVAQDRYNDAKVYYEEASFIFQKSGDILACRLSRLQKAEEA
jgi:tetratricopeptide (TPR) repeat protein